MITKRILSVCAITLAAAANHPVAAEQPLVVDEMVVVLIDAVNVPASESGVVADLAVREGDTVKVGEELATLDDRRSRLQECLAQTQFEIAAEKAENGYAADLARKKLSLQQQVSKQHEIVREIASKKAANEVRILASEKAEAVARNELDRATHARQEFVDSVSQSEIDSLRYAYQRTGLETQQADFERRIDGLHAKAEIEAGVEHQLGIDLSKIELARAVADERVQQLQVELQRHQSRLAELAILEHKVFSPLDGVVVEKFCSKGDWVNAGDPVVRVIRLNRLRAEGFVSAGMIERLGDHRNVRLTIRISPHAEIQRDGQVVFISPEIDPVNNEVRFWVEFDNPKRDVLPGMRLSLRSES